MCLRVVEMKVFILDNLICIANYDAEVFETKEHNTSLFFHINFCFINFFKNYQKLAFFGSLVDTPKGPLGVKDRVTSFMRDLEAEIKFIAHLN